MFSEAEVLMLQQDVNKSSFFLYFFSDYLFYWFLRIYTQKYLDLNHNLLKLLECARSDTYADQVIEVAKKILIKISVLNYYLKDTAFLI